LWQPYRRTINRWRKEKLNLPPFPFTGPLPMIYRSIHPTLYGISAHVYPKPADYPTHHHITGYWFLDRRDDWNPPASLEEFIAAGPPPFYFGLGSMTSNEPGRLSKILAASLKNTGQRGVLSTGWGNLDFGQTEKDLFTIDSTPHDWLFPRMRALIHHGGAGTTAAGLRAGKPTLVIPFFGDQPFWGDRVQALGVGPRLIRQDKLSERRLTTAIETILDSSDISSKAHTLGEKIKRERGLNNAVELIEGYLASQESIPQFT
jgi:sterol 3beta-glucosyltransferase